MHRVIKRTLLIILAVVLLVFVFRSVILDYAFQRFVSKAESRYGFRITVANKKTSGFTGVQLLNLAVLPAEGDTLLIADNIYLNPSLFSMLIGKIKLNELKIENMHVHLSCRDSVCNYLTRKKNENGEMVNAETDYARLVQQLFKNIFDFLPRQVALNNINIQLDKDSIHENIA